MIFQNENTNEGIQAMINEIQSYLPRCGDGKNMTFGAQGVVGDQLSVERGINPLMQIANGIIPGDRKAGIHFEIADLHSQMEFLQVKTL